MCIQRRVTEAGMGSPPWPHTPGAGTGVHLGWQHSPAPNREQSCRGINWEHKANHPASPVGGPFPSQVRIPWRQPSRWLRETWHTWNSRGNQTPPLILRGERCVSRPTECPYVTVPPRRGKCSLSGFPRSPGPAAAEISLSHWENPSALTHVWNVTEMYVSATVWTAEVDVWSRARLALSVATLCRWLELCSKTWV